jgi:hypothetical protein
MISQLQACSDYVSSAQNDSSWMHFLQLVLCILIYSTSHWIVHENFELIHSWIHPYVTEMKSYFTSSQADRESTHEGSYRVRDGCLMFRANQTNVTQQNNVYISQSDDKNDDSSVSTSRSTILTRLDVQKKYSRFSWTLKMWKTFSDIKNERNKNSQSIRCLHRRYRRVSSLYPLKCDRSQRTQQNKVRSRYQYQRDPVTFRNRIDNALDRAALWYYVDRRLKQKSR